MREAQAVFEKIQAAESLEQEITLTADECYLVIQAVKRLQYRVERGR